MIDLEITMIDLIDKQFPNYTVVGEYNDRENRFPVITVAESQNSTYQRTRTQEGEVHSEITFDIQVYDNGKNRRMNMKKISKEVCEFFDSMGFNRISKRDLHNLHDSTISRSMLRFRGILSEDLYVFTR